MYIKRTTRGSKLFSYLPRGQTRTFYLFSDKAPCVGWTWDCVYARLFNFDGAWKTPARMGSDLMMMMMMERGSRRANRFANTAELQSNIRGQSELSAINKNSSPGRWQSKKWNAKCQRAIWGLCVGHVISTIVAWLNRRRLVSLANRSALRTLGYQFYSTSIILKHTICIDRRPRNRSRVNIFAANRNKFINKLAWTSSAVLSVSGAGLQSNVSLFIAAERWALTD